MDSRNTLCHKSVKAHLILDINQAVVRDNTAELDYLTILLFDNLTILLFDNCRGAVGQSVSMRCESQPSDGARRLSEHVATVGQQDNVLKCKEKRAVISSATSRNLVRDEP